MLFRDACDIAKLSFGKEEWISRVARTLDEAWGLVEAGFEYVTEMDDVKIFRKRK